MITSDDVLYYIETTRSIESLADELHIDIADILDAFYDRIDFTFYKSEMGEGPISYAPDA